MNSHFANSVKVEKTLCQLLHEHNPLKKIWDYLFTEMQNNILDKWDQKDINSIASFLYYTEQHQSLFSFIDHCINKRIPLPWHIVSKLFSLCKKNSQLNHINYLIDGAKEQKSLNSILSEPSLISLSPDLQLLHKEFVEKEKKRKKRKKEELFEKMERASNEKLFKEEGNIINQMIKMFPNDKDVKDKYKNHREKWAKDIFSKAKQKKTMIEKKIYKDIIPDEQKTYLNYLYKYINNLKIKEKYAIDFSMLFYFIDDFEHALNLLKLHKDSCKEISWLKIELKLKLHLFLEVLEDTKTLSEKYKDHPETAFIVSYIQAIALWNLGKTEKAICFMQDVVNNKPDYRLASLYLSQWKREKLEN